MLPQRGLFNSYTHGACPETVDVSTALQVLSGRSPPQHSISLAYHVAYVTFPLPRPSANIPVHDLRTSTSEGDEEWPPAEFRKNGDHSSGPRGLFVDSDDEDGDGDRSRRPSNVSSVSNVSAMSTNQSYAQLQAHYQQLEDNAEQVQAICSECRAAGLV